MPSAIQRIVKAMKSRRPMSAARAEQIRREARDFAAQLLNGYALQTVRVPVKSSRRR